MVQKTSSDKKYAPPVRETEFSKTSVHNQEKIAPGDAWIVSDKLERDTLGFLKEASIAELRDVFQAVSACGQNDEGKFILFHAVNPDDEVQHTNSKLPSLHMHVFTSDFAGEFSHISDQDVKSYVVQPNARLAHTILGKADDADHFQTIHLTKENGGEIASHDILLHRGFTSFDHFAKEADGEQLNDFRNRLIRLIEPTLQDGQGGARIVIDDRYTRTGALTVQVLSGENMDRSGANLQRYFQPPITPAV